MSKQRNILLFFVVAVLGIGCDQVTKQMARDHLKDQPTITYLNDTVRLQYVENTGAALSLGDDLPKTVSFWVFSMLPLAFLVGVLLFSVKHAHQFRSAKMLSLALLFAGGIGNIIDRILHDRHVTDFMNIGFQSIRTGIFNVADICVTAGAIGLVFYYRDPLTDSAATPTNK